MKNHTVIAKGFSLALALALIFALLAGCSASAPSRNESSYDMSVEPQMAPAATQAPAEASAPETLSRSEAEELGYGYDQSTGGSMAPQSVANNATQAHKIIYTADLSLTTKQFDQTLGYIENKIIALGGYIANSSLNGKKPEEWNDPGRIAYITARIPSEKSESFIKDVQGEAQVESINRSSDDITAQFIDTKSRVDVLTIQLNRLKDILVTRDKLADVLELEREIARITLEIEQLTTNLRQWDNLVAYATVSIQLREVTAMTAPRPVPTDLGSRIQEGFYTSITGVGNFLSDLTVFLISALPVLVLLAIIGLAVWLIVKRVLKKNASKREKQKAVSNGYYKAYMERFGMPPPSGSMPPEVEIKAPASEDEGESKS